MTIQISESIHRTWATLSIGRSDKVSIGFTGKAGAEEIELNIDELIIALEALKKVEGATK